MKHPQRYKIKVPDVVSSDSYDKIRELLANEIGLHPYDRLPCGIEWITKEGRFVKRLQSYLYKTYDFKLSKDKLERIGQIAAPGTKAPNAYIDFTPTIDWKQGEFGDRGSCFWGSKHAAKDMLMSDPTFAAMRFWSSSLPGAKGIARCWTVIRCTEDNQPFIIMFNAYGRFQLQSQAMILAEFLTNTTATKHSVTDIAINNDGITEGVLHLNLRGLAKAIAPESTPIPATVNLQLKVIKDNIETHFQCDHCLLQRTVIGAIFVREGYRVCSRCIRGYFTYCDVCLHLTRTNRMYPIGNQRLCGDCYRANTIICNRCKERILTASASFVEGGVIWCSACIENYAYTCRGCLNTVTEINEKTLRCETCTARAARAARAAQQG